MQRSAIDTKTMFTILAVLFFLALLNNLGWLEGPKRAAVFLFSPAMSRFESSSDALGDFAYTIGKIGDFKRENYELEDKNRRLELELVQTNEVKRENDALRKQLGFESYSCAAGNCIDFSFGRIIGRSPDSNGRYILTDLGLEDGGANGMAVTTSGGIMIGKIVEVGNDYSKVMLLTSSDSSVNCLTEATRANGLLLGEYGTGATLGMIDQSEELRTADIIITSGLEAGIPKGLILGKIASVQQSPNTVFKSAEVELAADLGHIEEVYLAKSK